MEPIKLPVFGNDEKPVGTLEITDQELLELLKHDRRFLMAGEYYFRRSERSPIRFEDSKTLSGIRIAACGSGTAIVNVREEPVLFYEPATKEELEAIKDTIPKLKKDRVQNILHVILALIFFLLLVALCVKGASLL